MPMAEHKGYGLALCIDILSGVISGSGYSDNINRFYSDDNSCMNVGQTFIAIDPSQICDKDFYERIDDYIDKIHTGEAIFPGENFLISYESALEYGIEIDETLYEPLKKLSNI